MVLHIVSDYNSITVYFGITHVTSSSPGIPRLVEISRSTDVYSGQCVHVSNRVLAACWDIRDLRKSLKQEGWNMGALQRAPAADKTDGLEYDESRNQFKASYNHGLDSNTLTRTRSPNRHVSPANRHVSPGQCSRRIYLPLHNPFL